MAKDSVSSLKERVLRASSRSLGDFLDRDQGARALLDEAGLPSRDAYVRMCTDTLQDGGMGALRHLKHRLLLQIAALDLSGGAALEEVGRALSDLADACLGATLQHVEAPDSLAVIAMGKLGGRELNYVSDIDIMFVADQDVGVATKSAELLLKTLGEVAPEGRAFHIDVNLRPEGRSGALVRSLDGCLEYYLRWAKEWEYQALIKARAAAGSTEIGNRFVLETRGFVFPADVTAERVAGIRKMKERVEDHAAKSVRRGKGRDADDVKLGPGGIRDIEFSVQLLQLVHGGSDPSVRAPSTLEALLQLTEGGYVAEEDAAGLSVAYRWLRNVEHRLQLWQERSVRHLPDGDEERARLARSMGFADGPQASAVQRFEATHGSVLADVRSRFERLFYRPMIESLADVSTSRLSGGALKERLRILGFRDVDRAERTLSGLVSGTSRRAKLFRVLTPAVLRWLASSPKPDDGLLAFLQLGESLEDRIDILGSLRDNPSGLELLGRVLGSGRVLGDLLRHVPEEVQTIADPRGPGAPKDRDRLVREASASLQWREPERRLDGLRRFKRREMLRVALSDLAGEADVDSAGRGLADLADACLEAAIGEQARGFAVVGMGKLGGRELGYSSDIDVMFVHDVDQQEGERVAEQLVKTIGEVTPEGQAWRIDAALRPEGRSGPLARSLDSFVEYYQRWAKPWEHMALIRARHSAGDGALGRRLVEETRQFAYPTETSADALGEIRHLKARMERERIARGVDARRHIKLGPGGLSDVEFSVQILQLRHAHEFLELREPNTLRALEGALDVELLNDGEFEWLRDAYVWLTAARNRLFFMAGRQVDVLPGRPEDVEALGIAMGYEEQPRQELEEDFLRLTRRARRVAEPLIYGPSSPKGR